MSLEEIIEYILHSPGNTNPNMLRGILKEFQLADSDEISEQIYENLIQQSFGS